MLIFTKILEYYPFLFSYLFAVGLDNGKIQLYSWLPSLESQWKCLVTMDNNVSHHLTVKRLKFRPCLGLCGNHDESNSNNAENRSKESGDKNNWLQLASCSSDHSVKIFNINLSQLTMTG